MFELKLTNSLTRKKELFVTIAPKKVSIYICGITPYDYSHLGHGRSYVNFDVLVRLLKYLNYKVTYVRNYTDIDDKIINKAKELGDINLCSSIANKFIEEYQSCMSALNCLSPDKEPRVTEFIPQIINFISFLIKKSCAYVIDKDVYFDISSYKDYGKLSGRTEESLLAGARIEVDERKKNPGDFALWKGNQDDMFWKSPWGYGRPGWHIECSVMAKEILGETIDIHGGGMDLLFPHHENERAQSEALFNKTFVHYWLHNEFITINKEKMSKSLKNFVTLKDVFSQCDPMVLRYFFLQHHYRTPIDFSPDELNSAQTAYKRLITHLSNIGGQERQIDINKIDNTLEQEIMNSLCDDINTPKCLGLIFDVLSDIKKEKSLGIFIKNILNNILGLTLASIKEKELEITPQIETLLYQREQARQAKDWASADAIRDKLVSLGYKVQDKKLK